MRKNYWKSLCAAMLASVLVLTNSLSVLADTVSGNEWTVSGNDYAIATVSDNDTASTSGELVWDLDSIGVMSQTSTDFSIGAFNVIANGGVQIDAVSGVSADTGKEFAYCLNTKGSGGTAKRAVSFTVSSAVKVTVYARSGGDADRYLAVVNSEGTEVSTITAVGKAATTLEGAVVELPADTYYIYSKGSGINIYDIIVESNINLDLSNTEVATYTDNFTVGDFDILATSSKTVKIDSVAVTADDGTEFTKAVNLGGSGKTTYRAIQFTLPVSATLNVYALSGGDAARTLNVTDADGNVITTIEAAAKGDYVSAANVTLDAGTYLIYSKSGGINVYGICPKPVEVEQTPWADVPTPSITNVYTDADGNVVVEFDAAIDKTTGAEKVTVVMLENGFEFASVEVKSGKQTSVTFTPIWSSDYTFKIMAHRTGEADKIGAEYAYNGYVLPVKKPIVEMSQNRGNGVVYLDWINVEAADTYNVYYKLDSASDYTSYVTGSEDAHAEITGLTAGEVYDFKIEAVRNSDSYVATYLYEDFTVTANAEQLWYFGTVGSAQETHATVTDANGNVLQQVDMATKDETVNKVGITPATVDIVNTTNSISFTGTGNGKISDGEEGFQYFYTMIDPNTQNFELTATFELTELNGGVTDNQTGYGIIATDMLGYNYYGTDGLWIKHKQFNSVSTMVFGKAPFFGQRNISGYVSSDCTSVEDVTRVTEQTSFKNTSATSGIDSSTYTITLKKTNDAYVSVCNGEEISYADLSILSKQEDGSVCIGVFTSRKAGVKITDIQFSTSESTGVVAVEKSDAVTPSIAILSSANVGTSTYELIYHPNIAGKLTVADNAGNVVYEGNVDALGVAKVQVPVTLGKNNITSTFVPDASQKLTSYSTITKTTTVEYQTLQNENNVIYVGPNGSSSGDGTKANPYDLATVVKYAQPGQYIIMLNGTYNCGNITIGRSVSGTASKPICLVAESVNGVVLEESSLTIVGDYWHIYGLYVLHAGKAAIQISGNYNTIEMCTVEGSANTGIQISRSGSVDREAGLDNLLWPSYNLVKNCESFDNCDSGRNDADGFAAKLTSGEGNVFYGCIAHNNIDDGWDLFAKAISGEIGAVTIENCVAYNNGWMTYEDTTASGYVYGEGNGFKLGGNDMYGGHKLINSIAFGNIGKGITSNSCPDCEVYNSTSYGNAVGEDAAFNISLATKTSNHKRWIVEGLISLTANTTTADQIPVSYVTADNYIFDGSTSHNNAGVNATDDWFKSVDVSIVPTRNADGTINMQGLLEPTSACAADAGARLDTTSDEAKSTVPALPTVEPDDSDDSTVQPDDNTNVPSTDTSSDDDDDDDDDVVTTEPSTEATTGNTTSSTTTKKPSTSKPATTTEVKPTEKPAEVKPETNTTEKPAEEVKTNEVVKIEINVQLDADTLKDTLANVKEGDTLSVKVNNGDVVVAVEVFKAAAEKGVDVIFDCGDYTWEFSDLSVDTNAELKSLAVDTKASVPVIEQVLTGAKVVEDTRRTVSFAHDGDLPGKAKVTFSVADQFADGKELYFYYFDEDVKAFQLISKTVVADGKVAVELTHCSDYILSENELPSEIVISTTTTTAVDNGSNIPVIAVLIAVIALAAAFAVYMVYKKKSNTAN